MYWFNQWNQQVTKAVKQVSKAINKRLCYGDEVESRWRTTLKEKSLWGYPYPKQNLLIELKFMILFKPLKTRPYSVGCVLTWPHNQFHHLWTILSWTPFMYRVRDHYQTLWLTPRINMKVLAWQQQLGLALCLHLLDYQLATPL